MNEIIIAVLFIAAIGLSIAGCIMISDYHSIWGVILFFAGIFVMVGLLNALIVTQPQKTETSITPYAVEFENGYWQSDDGEIMLFYNGDTLMIKREK